MPGGASHLFLTKGDAVSPGPRSPAAPFAVAPGPVALRPAAVAGPVVPNARGSVR
jgi:hypothetical protein